MNWAQRRKLTYSGGLILVLLIVGYLLFQHTTSTVPSCVDNRKNGDEVGVDCGGACTLYCANELASPKIRWVRSFQMTPSIVHAVAYIEHNNTTAASGLVGYTFQLFDDKNTLIAERTGTTFLGPIGRSAIEETLIPTGNSTVARTTFNFTQPIVWQQIPTIFSQIVIKTEKTLIENYSYGGGTAGNGTRLIATLENTSRYSFTNMDVIAVLYDKDDNAITSSKIVLPSLEALTSKNVTFTWPFTLPSTVIRTEIIPRFNPFTARPL